MTETAVDPANQEVITITKAEHTALKADRVRLKELELQLEKIQQSAAPLKGVTVEDLDEIDDTDATDGEEVDDVDAEKEVDDHA